MSEREGPKDPHEPMIDKEIYARKFLDIKNWHQVAGYDFGKMNVVLDRIISECALIAEEANSRVNRPRRQPKRSGEI